LNLFSAIYLAERKKIMSFDGRDSEETLLPAKECPKCHKKGWVYYRGSSVMHGNPYSPAADTEVDRHYECRNCYQQWDEYF
jgi:DNA-directed RNA polymerase subunit M/transcription elongation factor TFIIS